MKTNKQATPEEKTIYVYHSSRRDEVVVLGRLGEDTVGTHITNLKRFGTVIQGVANSLSVLIETGKLPEDQDMTKYAPKRRGFFIEESIDEEMFLGTVKQDK